jgi:hypothetical protein
MLAIPLLLTTPNGCRQEQGTTRRDTVASADRSDSAGPLPAAAQRDTATGAPGSRLTADGWGPLRIGMTRAQVVAALGEDAAPNAVGGPDPGRCDEFRPRRAPRGMLVMIETGVLTRITLTRESNIRTAHGIGTRDSSAKVEEAYRDLLTSTPHQYIAAPARYLTVWTTPSPANRARGIRFVVNADDRVALIHAGARSIEYVEGCV